MYLIIKAKLGSTQVFYTLILVIEIIFNNEWGLRSFGSQDFFLDLDVPNNSGKFHSYRGVCISL